MDFNLALTHVERVAWDLVLSNQQISAQFACTKSANRVTAAYCLPFSELKIDEKKPFDLIWHHPIERFVELPIIKCNCLSTKCRKLTVAGDEVKRIEHRFQFELIPGIHSFATATLCRFELCTMWCHHGYYVCERQPCRNRIVFVFDDFPLRQTNPVSVLRHSQNKKKRTKIDWPLCRHGRVLVRFCDTCTVQSGATLFTQRELSSLFSTSHSDYLFSVLVHDLRTRNEEFHFE